MFVNQKKYELDRPYLGRYSEWKSIFVKVAIVFHDQKILFEQLLIKFMHGKSNCHIL